MNAATFEIALLQKFGGEPLTKRISLGPDGSVISDGGACIMSRGTATRFQYYDVQKLGEIIDQFGPDQAITLGTLRPDLPDTVEITTKRKLNGSGSNRLIARTKEYFQYRQREPALTLLDYDRKGMPGAVAERIKRLGGLEAALASIVPDITRTERLVRASTSAGLYREDTGDALPSSGGQHIFLKIRDGEDSERFLKVLHERCWLAGLGWKMVGAGGQLLDRSIVDRVVGTPERLVFEGPPVLVKPIAQDLRQRRPLAIAGGVLDSRTACPPSRCPNKRDCDNCVRRKTSGSIATPRRRASSSSPRKLKS